MPDLATFTAFPVPLPLGHTSAGRLAEEALQAIDDACSAEELYAFLRSFSIALGFDYFSYFGSDPLRLGAATTTDPMVGTSYPEPWRSRYLRLGYQQHDPVLTEGRSARRPFTWGDHDHIDRLDGKPRQILEEARAFGIGGGVSVPIYGPNGDRGQLSLSGRVTGPVFAAIVREALPVMHVVAHRVHAVMMERLWQPSGRDVQLTEHERECLAWTLRGKTAWEIAQILGRSRATVNFHLQKSQRKLGTSSKYQAATKAMQAGLL